MSIGKFFSPTVFVFLFLAVPTISAQDYPRPIGYVNDFAEILSEETKKALESKLLKYKKETTIEIVVVTVSSLEGYTKEAYTLGLAEEWGVGDKEKDNGIVLLVAPNEREMRIEVGYGMEPDLPDGVAGRIIRNIIIPHFKDDDMPGGIIAGIDAIIDRLGDTPYETRLEERLIEEKRRRIEAEATKETMKMVGLVFIIGLAFSVAIVFIIRTILHLIAKRKFLRSLYKKNAGIIELMPGRLKELEISVYQKTKKQLEKLKKENPPEVWKNCSEKFNDVFGSILNAKSIYKGAFKAHKEGWKHSENANKIINFFEQTFEECEFIFEEVDALYGNIIQARTDAPKLIKLFPEKLKNIKEQVFLPNVLSNTKQLVNVAQDQYLSAVKAIDGEEYTIHWLVAFAFINGAMEKLRKAEQKAEEDKKKVLEAQTKIPIMLEELPALIKDTEKILDDDDVSDKAKNLFEKGKKEYKIATKIEDNNSLSLIMAFTLLSSAVSLLAGAKETAKNDKARAKRKRKSRNSYVTESSWSSRSSSSLSGSGGGFGGFSGGSFGGGGASGSW